MVDLYANIRPAKFRGIDFETPQGSNTVGRRIKRHNFVENDTPSHQDLGLKTPNFKMTCVIRGDDYYDKSLAFEQAINQPGEGQLVHPFYGTLNVVVISAQRNYQMARVGESVFQLEFELAGSARTYDLAHNTAIDIDTTTETLDQTSATDFVNAFPDNLPDYSVNETTAFLDETQSQLQTMGGLSLPQSYAWSPHWPLGNASALAANILGVYQSIADAFTPSAAPVVAGMSQAQTATNHVEAVGDILNIAAVSPDNSASHIQSTHLLQSTGQLNAAARIIRNADFESVEQAVITRDKFVRNSDMVLNQLGDANWHQSWSDLGDVTAAVTRDINQRLGRLPKIAVIENNRTRPSMLLAHFIYGDQPEKLFDQSKDLTKRNRTEHPGFFAPGHIEVLDG